MGYDAYTKLMLHLDGVDGATATTDESDSAHTIIFNGDAQLDTAQKKFGLSSLLLDGVGDYISCADSDDWFLLNGDFTVDQQVRFSSVATDQPFVSQRADGNTLWYMQWLQSTGELTIFDYESGTKAKYRASWSPSINTWYHIAFVRSGTTCFMFVDGVSQSVTIDTAWNSPGNITAPLDIGHTSEGNNFLSGWIDEQRISKGIARWTSNFTPPSAPYPPTSQTVLNRVGGVLDRTASGVLVRVAG